MTQTKNDNPILDIPNYLATYKYYLGKRIYVIFALTLFSAIAEGVGILMLMPLLQNLGSSENNVDDPISAALLNFLDAIGWGNSSVAVVLAIGAAFILKGILLFLAQTYQNFLRAELLRELKSSLFDCYNSMDFQYYASKDSGHFINIINMQINDMLAAFRSLVLLGAQMITAGIYIALAFLVAWRFGLMALVFGVMLLSLFKALNIRLRKISRETAAEAGRLSALVIQFLYAFKYIASTGQSRKVRKKVVGSIYKLTDLEFRKGVAQAFTNTVREPIAVTFIVIILVVQIEIYKQPLTPILVSILLFYRGMNGLLALQLSWQSCLSSIGALEIVRDEFSAQENHKAYSGGMSAPKLEKSIEFRDVTFRYNGLKRNVLEQLNMKIIAKQTVAIVGESGAGKSTFADLLTLLLQPDSGSILIDDLPSRQVNCESWRSRISYVSQESVIFDDSLRNNISMWDDDNSESEVGNRVVEAAAAAHIADFIEELPERYETNLGDRGLRLSGGQKQRICIARELYKKPTLLILDEATSALDSESERNIQYAIDSLRGQITVVIIAHRLSTIKTADSIVVLEAGRVAEQGSYEQLVARDDSLFSKLVSLQKL